MPCQNSGIFFQNPKRYLIKKQLQQPLGKEEQKPEIQGRDHAVQKRSKQIQGNAAVAHTFSHNNGKTEKTGQMQEQKINAGEFSTVPKNNIKIPEYAEKTNYTYIDMNEHRGDMKNFQQVGEDQNGGHGEKKVAPQPVVHKNTGQPYYHGNGYNREQSFNICRQMMG